MKQWGANSDSKSRYRQWAVTTAPLRSASVLFISVLSVSLLTACVNNPDFVALEQLPPHGGEPQRASQSSGTTSSASRSQSSSPSSSSSSRPATQSRPVPDRSSPPATEAPPDTYVVESGDTLYSIAFRYGLDFKEVAAANDIGTSYTIVPGQRLTLREQSSSRTASAPSTQSSSSSGSGSSSSSSGSSSRASGSSGAPAASASSSSQNTATSSSASSGSVDAWTWPVEGTIVRPFSNSSSGSRGIDIDAPLGESVIAAADGKVVYAGDGLRGYGNLIILEHAGRMLSAYAFTEAINVSEQQEVRRGDVIASVGSRGDTPLLHFEIRQEGKPVDPVSYLPQR